MTMLWLLAGVLLGVGATFALGLWISWRRAARKPGVWSQSDHSDVGDPSEHPPPLYMQGWREGQEALRTAWAEAESGRPITRFDRPSTRRDA